LPGAALPTPQAAQTCAANSLTKIKSNSLGSQLGNAYDLRGHKEEAKSALLRIRR
jgi:hypothetical protein